MERSPKAGLVFYVCLYITLLSTNIINHILFLQVSPVVHQLDHFVQELASITDSYVNNKASLTKEGTFGAGLSAKYKPRNTNAFYVDRAWQAIKASQCLFDCVDSEVFH